MGSSLTKGIASVSGGGKAKGGASREVRKVLKDAISQGAPVYNTGDHAGCARIYVKAAAEAANVAGEGAVASMLTEVVRAMQDEPDPNKRAWALRRVFDSILAGSIHHPAPTRTSSSGGSSSAPPAGAASPPSPEVCQALEAAIQEGVPVYNSGDRAGCARIYLAAATAAAAIDGAGAARQMLAQVIQAVEQEGDPTKRAWALRHVFDDILAGRLGRSVHALSASASSSGEGSSSTRRLELREVHRRIRHAISRGAPVYNRGSHRTCRDIYQATAEAIIEQGASDRVCRRLAEALQRVGRGGLAMNQAWVLRHAFDAILRDCGDDDDEEELEAVEAEEPGGLQQELPALPEPTFDYSTIAVDKELECPICLVFMVDAVSLGCSHRFCRACLLQSTRMSPDGRSCPLCRQAIDIKDLMGHPEDEAVAAAVAAAVPSEVLRERADISRLQLARIRLEANASLPVFAMHPGTAEGAEVALHLFEPRYKVLIRRCWEGNRRFLYCASAPRPGARAVVVNVHTARFLADGRANIVGTGEREVVLGKTWVEKGTGGLVYSIVDQLGEAVKSAAEIAG